MTAVRRMQLVRLGVWASLATAAVLVAMAAANTEAGVRRIAGLTSPEAATRGPKAAPASRSFDAELEARRLNEAVRVLSADRDRLLARVAVLERNVDDMGSMVTGSIPSAQSQQPRSVQVLPQIPAQVVTPAPAPAPTPQAVPAAPVSRVTTTATGPQESIATKTEFGIDVGGNASVEGLRSLWANLKTSQPTLFEGLRPVIAIRDVGRGAVELRLVAGPVLNAAAAAKLCASLTAAGQQCQPTVFDGQRLALQ